ncbi:peptidase [Clostridia bacterium]|nr:peptidase [Clostridia bacterium]
MERTKDKYDAKKRSVIYLLLTVGFCLVVGFISILAPLEMGIAIYSALQKMFTAIAVIAVLITRILTKDKSDWNLSFKVWKNGKVLLFSAFLPGLTVLLGACVYYLLFPNELSLNAAALLDFCVQYGLPTGIGVSAGTIAITAIVLWFASALAIPIHLLELGEEIGWRGYLLPQLLKFMSDRSAALISGILWGIMHAPLIYFGFNYGNGYWGAPYSGILLMIVLCVSLGICMSYTMLKTNNCMYAAIIHGAFNVAADMQIISHTIGRPLLGPAPTGIIGMSLILVTAIVLFLRIPTKKY